LNFVYFKISSQKIKSRVWNRTSHYLSLRSFFFIRIFFNEFIMIIAVVHTTKAAVKLKPEKKFRPELDSNPWPLRWGAVLCQLNNQVIWELVTLRVRNIPVKCKGCKWIYERSYIWTAEKGMNSWLIIAVIHTT